MEEVNLFYITLFTYMGAYERLQRWHQHATVALERILKRVLLG